MCNIKYRHDFPDNPCEVCNPKLSTRSDKELGLAFLGFVVVIIMVLIFG